MAKASRLVKDVGSKELPSVWNVQEHSFTQELFGRVWFQWGSKSDIKTKFGDAINHEIAILDKLALAWYEANGYRGNAQQTGPNRPAN